MSQVLSRFTSIFVVAASRLWANRWLSIASAWGFVAVIVFALCVPLYADAVYHRVLTQELAVVRSDGPRLPPFAFVFRNGVYWQQADPWTAIQHADFFVDRQLPGLLQLKRQEIIRYLQTTPLEVLPADSRYGETDRPLVKIPLTSVSAFGEHVRLVEGEMGEDFFQPTQPLAEAAPNSANHAAPLPVLVSQPLADKLGIQSGDRYAVHATKGLSAAPLEMSVVVAGVWAPLDQADPYWFNKPYLMADMLIVSEPDFIARVAPRLDQRFGDVLWYADFDGDPVRVWDAPALIAAIQDVIERGKRPQLNISLPVSPLAALERYQRDSQALVEQLYVFSIPLFALAFVFILLVAGLTTNDQRNEVAVLRSRGASVWQVMGISLAQAALLGAAAFVAAIPLATIAVRAIGQTRSFLSFTGDEVLPVVVTAAGLPVGAALAVATVIVMVLPMFGAAQRTIITHKQEVARVLRAPWWQRIGLDFLILAPAVYWTYLLRQSGMVDILGSGVSGDGPFRNPSLFLVPALSMVALTLLLVRILPIALRLLAALATRLPGTALVLALRQLSRSPGTYATPVMLLVLTVALAAFTASVAATLDQHLDQQARYDVGADVRLHDTGQAMNPDSAGDWFGQAAESPDQNATAAGPRWVFLPIFDYLKVPGVAAAARVGNYEMVVSYAIGGRAGGRFLGIDRNDYAHAGFWRKDFAAQPLMGLMNALAATPDGVLIPDAVARVNRLSVGDRIRAAITFPDARVEVDTTFTIVGTFDLWPTWYPNKGSGAVFVGNLDYMFELAGGQMPYDVWLRLQPGADASWVVEQLRATERGEWKHTTAQALVRQEQARPQRQGLFGMLSIGFVGSAILTLFGFFLYAVFSYRRRFIELGVLRAIGLSTRQMILVLGAELAVLLLLGILAGTALGVACSQWYIPFLQAPATSELRAAPFQIVIDWPRIWLIYGLFGALFIAALIALSAFLARLRIFQAVKLGETA